MKKNTTIFERIEKISTVKGIKGIKELAEILNYSSPEKIYRIGRSKNARPSFNIIFDLAEKFEDLNVRWLITGEGMPFPEMGGGVVSKLNVAPQNSETLSEKELYRLKSENKKLQETNETYLRIIEALSKSAK